MENTRFHLDPKIRKYILAVLLLLIAVLSLTVVGNWATSPDRQAGTIRALDEKKEDVLELTAASTATSVAISMLPGDAATPIAEQLADLSKYFLLILCAIYFEKYLVTITGFVTFRVLIPIAMLLFVYYVFRGKPSTKRLASRITAFGLVLFLVIPTSVWVTGMIERTYESSIQSTIESAENAADELEGDAKEPDGASGESGKAEEETQEETGIFEKLKDLPASIAGSASSAISSVTEISADKITELEELLNHFIESVAVMIITSCVIPILVLVFFVCIVRILLEGKLTVPPAIRGRMLA